MWMLSLKLLINKLQSIYPYNLHREKGLGIGMNRPRMRNGINSYRCMGRIGECIGIADQRRRKKKRVEERNMGSDS